MTARSVGPPPLAGLRFIEPIGTGSAAPSRTNIGSTSWLACSDVCATRSRIAGVESNTRSSAMRAVPAAPKPPAVFAKPGP